MAVSLVFRSRYVYPDGAVREMVLWMLPKKLPKSSHRFKYRLYYGRADGTCMVRYDNESSKGDHCHRGDSEEPYHFRDVETLVADFLDDIANARRGAEDEKEHSR